MSCVIKILTACDEKLLDIANLNRPILNEYCLQHGYELVIKDIVKFDKHPAWFKLLALTEELNKQDCDYILWMDTDTLILNSNFKLESLLKPDKYFYISKDANGINSGVFIIANNDLMKSMIAAADSLYSTYMNHGYWEQAAIMHLLHYDDLELNKYVEYVPPYILNAYDRSLLHTVSDGYVNEHTFILHLPSIDNQVRHDTIKSYINKLNLAKT